MSNLFSLAEPVLGEAEIGALTQVINSGWITMGEKVMEFETSFAKMHDKRDAIALNSCTAGLHLALAALDIGEGDQVMLPSLTFVATANAVKYVGAEPVFVDINSIEEPHISIQQAERYLTDKTRAVMIMHYGGYLCDVKAWRKFADKHGLYLIEDAAHAPGCPDVGKYGDICCYSFFSNKNMTTAEGGVVTANDEKLLDRLKLMRSHGMTSVTLDRHKGHAYSYDVIELGFNYRLDELRAAIGIEQLKKLLSWNEKRRILSAAYRQLFDQAEQPILVPFSIGSITSAHLMPIILPSGTNRQGLMELLREGGVQSSIHYPPVHKFSFYQELSQNVSLPITEEFCARELSLPLHPKLSEQDIEKIVNIVLASL